MTLQSQQLSWSTIRFKICISMYLIHACKGSCTNLFYFIFIFTFDPDSTYVSNLKNSVGLLELQSQLLMGRNQGCASASKYYVKLILI